MNRFFATLLLLAGLFIGMTALAQDDMSFTVTLGGNDDLGTFFVDAEGMTLYIFTNDDPGVSNCAGDCLAAWPPLLLGDDDQLALDPAISGVLSIITRDDETRHVTYNGMPLYYWQDDAQPGDATGHTLGDVWFVATMPQIGLGGNDALGDFLVGESGYTLYIFTNDEPGTSNCTGGCAAAWPPLLVESADSLRLQPGLVGDFTVIEREDGSLQAALNDQPLYFWQEDAQPGDATGEGVGDVWFVAKLPTLAVVESDDFGQILTGANGMTLYTFSNDEAGSSVCVGGCAAAWPPLTVAADEAIVAPEELAGELATIEREDGSLQVSYNGAPLYYWVLDVIPGDTTGHTVGDVWFVAQP